MSVFSAEQRAELRAAIDVSRREAVRQSAARAAGPGTEAATLDAASAFSAADSHTEAARTAEASPGSAGLADAELLLLAEAQTVILRIHAATDPDYPDRAAHIARVAVTAVRSKLQPCNAFARPTFGSETTGAKPADGDTAAVGGPPSDSTDVSHISTPESNGGCRQTLDSHAPAPAEGGQFR